MQSLVRHSRPPDGPPKPPREGVSLDDVLWSDITRLPGDARAMLEVLAVAARPLGLAVVLRAAGLGGDGHPALARLKAGRLVRRGGRHDDALETYHDRVRAAVVGRLAPEVLRARHARLAEAWKRPG